MELFSIRWADVESYCRSTEEMRFNFIAGEWQQVRKEFPNHSFFKVIDSPYIKWIKEQAGGFMDDDKLIHFMIVSADYVLDTVSKYEPDEYYLSKLTCSDSTKISLWHNLLCNFIDFS